MAYTACPLVTQQGKTTIADTLVAKIAGIATREISGVHDLGAGPSRVVGALRERIPGGRVNQGQGVSVEVGERQARGQRRSTPILPSGEWQLACRPLQRGLPAKTTSGPKSSQ